MKTLEDGSTKIEVGDVVQIANGGIDVTNGRAAKAGRMYGEGGPLWATVDKIVPNWNTGGKWGLPAKVEKYRCANNGVVVWQVQEKDLVPKANPKAVTIAEEPVPKSLNLKSRATNIDVERDMVYVEIVSSGRPFAPNDTNGWLNGLESSQVPDTKTNYPKDIGPEYISASMFSADAHMQTPSFQPALVYGIDFANMTYTNSIGQRRNISKDNAKYHIQMNTARRVYVPNTPFKAVYLTSWQNNGRKAEMRNAELSGRFYKASSRVQNKFNYPKFDINYQYKAETAENDTPLTNYDYQIIPGDRSLPYGDTLEERLARFRASAGLMVHGDNDVARSVKFYMYNRYKVPDTNLAFNRMTTHIFFTRPDLNIINPITERLSSQFISSQCDNNTDTALIWRRYPELFKLLTNCRRNGDSNNFNFLLSNQISSFGIQDETIATVKAGKSWRNHEVVYGQNFTSKMSDTFSCTFDETSELSITNLLNLWMLYIENVSTGMWSPNYKNYNYEKAGYGHGRYGDDHVYLREIDYAASAYVFKCGPDGEDILHWTKYYGVFPISNGAGAMGWERSSPIGTTPSLNVTFAYSFKRVMSPISLMEFNYNSGLDRADRMATGGYEWLAGYNKNIAGFDKPFVGKPFIEITLPATTNSQNKIMNNRDDAWKGQRASIRLKFLNDEKALDGGSRSDKILYTSHHGLRK